MRLSNLILLISVIFHSTTPQLHSAAITPAGASPPPPTKAADPKKYLTIKIGSSEIHTDQYTQMLTCTETPAKCVLNFSNYPKGLSDPVDISQGPDYITATELTIGNPNAKQVELRIANLLKIKLPLSSVIIINYRAEVNYINIAALACTFQDVQFKSFTLTFKCSQQTQLKNSQL